jgi:hypothetical protein
MKIVLYAMEPRLVTSLRHGGQGFLNCLFLIRRRGGMGGQAHVPSFIVPASWISGILQSLNIERIAPEMNGCDLNRNSDHPEYAL